MSRFEIAKAAFGALRAHVESTGGSAGKREYNIPTELVIRESTGTPRSAVPNKRKSKRS
jgi:hypothetical protein